MSNVAQQLAERNAEVIEVEAVNWNSRPESYVAVAGPDKYGCWTWQRHTATRIETSRTNFRSANVAAVAAVIVARCHGVPAVLPRSTRPAVATYYRKHGKTLYDAGELVGACRNEFERLGYTLA